MEDADEDVFEDALEEVDGISESFSDLRNDHVLINNNNDKSKSSSLKSFKLSKLKRKKSERSPEAPSTPSADKEPLPLSAGIAESQEAIDLFFNNKFEEARAVSERHCDRSIYHALGRGTFHYLRAIMTFDQDHVEQASAILSESVAVIDHYRRKAGGLTGLVRRCDSDQYSELELHAELVYAECLLLKAMLTVCEDETLVSFVKAGLKIRQCYVSFKECWNILQNRDWSKDHFKNHFEGGVRLGVGTFNLLMSLLPPRITKLLEFVGFTGSRDIGLSELLRCYRDQSCLRQFLSSIILLGYHLFICNHMGQTAESDYALVSEILASKLSKYPNGAFFLFFQGRYELVQAKCQASLTCYTKANSCQSEWPQFHHVAYWEMMWASCYQGDWRGAVTYSGLLLQHSKWSPCTYSYLKAAFLSQLSASGCNLTSDEEHEQNELMEVVPSLRQKIAGKSLPMEKFAARKAALFLSCPSSLLLPGLELVYLWGGFTILGQEFSLLEPFYVQVQEAEQGVQAKEARCLLLLLKGMCLKHLGAPLAAEECFKEVLVLGRSGGGLAHSNYLVPYTTLELALLLLETQSQEAGLLLEQAKNYKDYSLQSRLHFRIHAAQAWLKDREKGKLKEGKQESRAQDLMPHLNNYEDQASSI